MAMKMTRVLLVDDDAGVLGATTAALEDFGFEVIPASSGAEALMRFKAEAPDVAVLDLNLPDMDGVDVCRQIRAWSSGAQPSIPVIFLSAFDDPIIRSRAIREKSVEGYILKPHDVGLLARQVEIAVEKWKELAHLQEQATHDALTGLPNRRLLLELLEREYHRSLRSRSYIGCLMIDVDYFKRINDQYGHPAGDVVLQEISHRLSLGIRRQDFLGRWGGEEFIAILPETDRASALAVAERLRTLVSDEPFELPGKVARQLTISIGISNEPAELTSPEKLITEADRHLLIAKQTRNSIHPDASVLEPARVVARR